MPHRCSSRVITWQQMLWANGRPRAQRMAAFWASAGTSIGKAACLMSHWRQGSQEPSTANRIVHACRWRVDEQVKSVQKLAQYDWIHILPGHGRWASLIPSAIYRFVQVHVVALLRVQLLMAPTLLVTAGVAESPTPRIDSARLTCSQSASMRAASAWRWTILEGCRPRPACVSV